MAQTRDCALRKVPPEIRETIFHLVIAEWIEQNPRHLSGRSVHGGYGIERYGECDRSPALERALIGEKDLFRDIFALRIKLSQIRVDPFLQHTLIGTQSPFARASIRSIVLTIR